MPALSSAPDSHRPAPATTPTSAAPPFVDLPQMIGRHAAAAPERQALVEGHRSLSYRQLDARMSAIAAALQRDGLRPGDSVAVCGSNSLEAALVFLGALRAGLAVAPLAPGATPTSLQRMMADADARIVFADSDVDLGPDGPCRISLQLAGELATDGPSGPAGAAVAAADDRGAWPTLDSWMAAPQAFEPVEISPEAAFNIIYSSGTTGEPKGIVQPHAMRFAYAMRAQRFGYGPATRALVSTPLYSNTTLVVFFPTLHFGGTAVLMRRFDAGAWLALAAGQHITHAMLVPVQLERLLAHADFDRTDLSRFEYKFCTSAPLRAAVKRELLARWPGGLVEIYGLTEGGGSCLLEAHRHPDKLHTVGQPAPGHDIRLIDEAGSELPAGATGEVVGRSPSMMTGYHKRPQATRDAEWFDAQGQRFIRTGDIGRFDADGFLELLDRRKDVVISGGFNIYPSDLEAVLREHPAVAEAAVVGVPSDRWGETPVGFVVWRADTPQADEPSLLAWANARLGKTQRLHALRAVRALPRNAIGKVLKRELRQQFVAEAAAR